MVNVYSLKDSELRQVLLSLNLSISGKKAEKLARIIDSLKERGHNPEVFDVTCFLNAEVIGVNSDQGGDGDMRGAGVMEDEENVLGLDDEQVRGEVNLVQDKDGNADGGYLKMREEIKELFKDLICENRRKLDDMGRELFEILKEDIGNAFREQNLKAVQEKSRHQPIKSPTYEGTLSYTVFQKQFEAVAMMNGWNTSEKGIHLSLALGGKAAELLQSIPNAKMTDYEFMTNQLQARFGDGHMKQLYRAQLRTRTQKVDETLQELESDINRLVQMAYPNGDPEFLNELGVEMFINGIRDSEVKQALLLTDKKSMNEALSYALLVQGAKEQSSRNPVRTIREDSAGDFNSSDHQDILKEIKGMMQNGNFKNNAREVLCWNCNK